MDAAETKDGKREGEAEMYNTVHGIEDSKYLVAFIGGFVALVGGYMLALVTTLAL